MSSVKAVTNVAGSSHGVEVEAIPGPRRRDGLVQSDDRQDRSGGGKGWGSRHGVGGSDRGSHGGGARVDHSGSGKGRGSRHGVGGSDRGGDGSGTRVGRSGSGKGWGSGGSGGEVTRPVPHDVGNLEQERAERGYGGGGARGQGTRGKAFRHGGGAEGTLADRVQDTATEVGRESRGGGGTEGAEAEGVVGEGTPVVGIGMGHGKEAAEHRADGGVTFGDSSAGVEFLGKDLDGRDRGVDCELANRVEDVGKVLLGADGAGVLVASAGGTPAVAAFDGTDAAADEAEEGVQAEDRALASRGAGGAESVVPRLLFAADRAGGSEGEPGLAARGVRVGVQEGSAGRADGRGGFEGGAGLAPAAHGEAVGAWASRAIAVSRGPPGSSRLQVITEVLTGIEESLTGEFVVADEVLTALAGAGEAGNMGATRAIAARAGGGRPRSRALAGAGGGRGVGAAATGTVDPRAIAVEGPPHTGPGAWGGATGGKFMASDVDGRGTGGGVGDGFVDVGKGTEGVHSSVGAPGIMVLGEEAGE